EHKLTQDLEADPTDAEPRKERSGANQSPSPMDVDKAADIDTQLDPHLNFKNYVEGTSNKLARSLGLSIAEHPSQPQFNPMFIYGPSGCGKTHLINAIGLRCKQLYPEKRVLYISARLFQSQFVDANLHSSINDFIRFYQTIDMLIVDDIQEWVNATKTQDTFFHIFNHLFRNGKRILLVSDRPPVDLKGMNERLLTRFSCGLIAELEKPNVELCTDILKAKIRRDGLHIPDEVIRFIASTANGSVRDLEGVVNSLLAYSVVYNSNVDMRLAERVIKRAVKVDDNPLTVDEILDTVCNHFSVTLSAVNSKSRKHDLVIARQVTMYLAQKYTKMPASRIGRLVGNRDHSTVIHSCAQVENRLKVDSSFKEEVNSIEVSFKLKS
ncbi:MAG: chromosomal replication initiator protein DnaA, partial [Segatella sp.]